MTKQAKRLYWLNQQLQAGLYPNADRMKELFGIARTAAFQDKLDLEDIQGVSIKFSRIHNGWHYTEACQPLPVPQVTDEEAADLRRALLISREALGPEASQRLENLSNRLGQYVRDIRPRSIESAGGAIRAFNAARAEYWLSLCETATKDRQKLRLRYDGAHNPGASERIVHPYHLHIHQGEWFVVAFCEMRQNFRTFLLTRIEDAGIVSEPCAFAIRSDFDQKKEVDNAISMMAGDEVVQVLLVFDSYQSRWTRERELHPTETRTELPEGRLQIGFEAPWGDGAALTRLVLGYGSHVEVVQPPKLRERLHSEIAAMKKMYE